jgi:prepilin-type processing-associated H-X9-DG protein
MSETTVTPAQPKLSGLALAGLLLGLAAPFTILTAPLALYFGYRGLYAVNASNGRLLGRGAAIVGLFLGGLVSLVAIIGSCAIVLLHVRAADARVQCANNQRVIGVALNQYYDNNGKVFPRAAVPIEGVKPDERPSWLAAVLPYVETKTSGQTQWQALAGRLDLTKPWDDPANSAGLNSYVSFYQCPGAPDFDPHSRPGQTHYVGVAGVGDDAAYLPRDDPYAGFFGYNRTLTLDSVIVPSNNPQIKGTSYKMMLLETTQHNGPWLAAGQPTLRGVDFDPTFFNWQATTLVGLHAAPQDDFGSSVGGVLLAPRPEGPSLIGPERPFGGCHQGGVNVLWADGSVRFVSDTISPHAFRMQASLSNDEAALANLP